MGTTPVNMKLRPGRHSIKSVPAKGLRHTNVVNHSGDKTKLVIGH